VRRLILANVLIIAVLAAAAGLAYYGLSYSREVSNRERAVIVDTMRELAEEKVFGIERELVESDTKILRSVSIHNLLQVQDLLKSEQAPVARVLILDENLQIVPDGYLGGKRSREEDKAFRRLFEERVVHDLPLRETPTDVRGHLHAIYDGQTYLFSFMRRVDDGTPYYVVLEADSVYLVLTVFPEYFDVPSTRLYQVIDEYNDHVFGHQFVSGPDVIEVPFADTVSLWRLRVTEKDTGARAARSRRQVIDVVLIVVAITVMVAGLAVLLLAARRERRANALKSDFISNVSHELKTPLSIISMFGEMLATGRVKSQDQANEYADIIWRESVRLARLIDNVLDFAKIERGSDVYEFAEGDVAEVVQRALELSIHRLQKANLEVTAHYDEDLPLARIDANALTLAVLNLVDNAIKYAADGKRLEVAVRHAPRAKRIVLSVRDFGPGIAADEHERIFERFYRSRAVRLLPMRGSGIGLALVKHIALAHGGEITVESEPSKGATFRLWIPTGGEE
jgi:two-component system phosphate regulon sensor histidine kinase PhoR